jgi:hypothetical protein
MAHFGHFAPFLIILRVADLFRGFYKSIRPFRSFGMSGQESQLLDGGHGMQILCAVAALLSGLATANIPEQPQWQKSYSDARVWAADKQKPLAVFIGSGVSGWEKLSKDGAFDPKVYQLLKDKYACVYIDSDTEAGKEMAKRFAVETKGLIISDKTLNTEAFYHNGDLSKDLVAKALERYADTAVASTTETAAALAPSAPVMQYSCPSCPNYGGSYGGCPGGNCPRR